MPSNSDTTYPSTFEKVSQHKTFSRPVYSYASILPPKVYLKHYIIKPIILWFAVTFRRRLLLCSLARLKLLYKSNRTIIMCYLL